MSYVRMDHADWVQRQITASKKFPLTAVERKMLAQRRGWHAAPDALTEDQARMFDILGMIGGGIYNAPIQWETLWWYPNMLGLSWRNPMASYDFNNLTRLVFLCHEARIRCWIAPQSKDYLRLHLSALHADGGVGALHPNLDEAVAAFREYLPAEHRILYRAPAPAVEEA